jgi:integrase
MKVTDLCQQHATSRRLDRVSKTALACDGYGYRLIQAAAEDMEAVKLHDIKTIIYGMQENGLSNATINEAISHAKMAIEWAIDEELIEINPLKRQKKLPTKPKLFRRPLLKRECDAIRKVAKGRWQTIFELFICTGCRRNEIRLLPWSEVDFETGIIALAAERTKTRTARPVALGHRMLEKLSKLPRSDGLVLPGQKKGQPLGASSIRSHLKESLCKRAGVDPQGVTTHSLRDTTACFLTDELEVSDKFFDAIIGHKGGGKQSALKIKYSKSKALKKHKHYAQMLEDYIFGEAEEWTPIQEDI